MPDRPRRTRRPAGLFSDGSDQAERRWSRLLATAGRPAGHGRPPCWPRPAAALPGCFRMVPDGSGQAERHGSRLLTTAGRRPAGLFSDGCGQAERHWSRSLATDGRYLAARSGFGWFRPSGTTLAEAGDHSPLAPSGRSGFGRFRPSGTTLAEAADHSPLAPSGRSGFGWFRPSGTTSGSGLVRLRIVGRDRQRMARSKLNAGEPSGDSTVIPRVDPVYAAAPIDARSTRLDQAGIDQDPKLARGRRPAQVQFGGQTGRPTR
jgi:hypothetical protein